MMYRNILCFFALFLTGCASYVELIPNPEIVPKEGQFTNLKNGAENFILKKNEKYVIQFPRPEKNDFYLVLMGKTKPLLYCYIRNYFNAEIETTLTQSFGFREGSIQNTFDENPASDSICVYPIDSLSEHYSWLIDTVRQETELALRYRYVYQWRYKFENDYDKYREILADNIVDRTTYNIIDANFNTDVIDFDRLIATATPKNKNLQSMYENMRKLEQVFPPDIKEFGDTAYSTYTAFRANVNDELLFQNNYLDILTNLKKEKETRDDIVSFLKAAPEFMGFLSNARRYPARINEKTQRIFAPRLYEILPYYEKIVKNSSDIYDIGSHQELDYAPKIFKACNVDFPDDLANLITFFHKYNAERDALLEVDNTLADLNTMVATMTGRPDESFYRAALAVLDKTQTMLPESEASHVAKYGKYKCAVMLDHKNNSAAMFVESLTGQLKALQVLDDKLEDIDALFKQSAVWPSDMFYTSVRKDMEEIESSLPKSLPAQIDPYSSSKIALWAKKRLTTEATQIKELLQKYQKAEEIVPQINTLRKQENYRGIIRLLNANRTLGFLLSQYPGIDTLSLGHQSRTISSCLSMKAWRAAETKIDELFRDRDYLSPDVVAEKRIQYVKKYESELFQGVNIASRSSSELFIKNHETSLKNIPSLYKDSAFVPVYKLTFSSTGPKELQQKKKQIEDYLTEMKIIHFPETAIKALYKELTKNIREQGVEKARAIVDHGKFYKGSDKQVKSLVGECDCTVPKIITKPSEYRKFFVLPSTNNKKGNNNYLLRLDMQISSEAEFPVFDVNIAIPPELAQNAEQKAWFDEITINKKQIKNEGRFHITAPTSANNYESQVTPVQLSKGSTNILEIKLKYNGFRAFEVSVMAQKPIIRKY
ncbi:MAG: hypothetical protein NTX44_00780 [Ignavibacteriales bacterium]|nr:hypothetical protein [Ignavibacteriales bacterium]